MRLNIWKRGHDWVLIETVMLLEDLGEYLRKNSNFVGQLAEREQAALPLARPSGATY